MIVNSHYQQQSGQGCLPICLAYMYTVPVLADYEAQVLIKGLFSCRDSYALGVCQAFLAEYPEIGSLQLLLGNKYHMNQLLRQNTQPKLNLRARPLRTWQWAQLSLPCIVSVDRWVLGEYSHMPHYVVLTRQTKHSFWVFDPWFGTVQRRRRRTIEAAIKSYQDYLKMAPICIQKLNS